MHNFFRKHPRIHSTVHWLAFATGGIMLVQDKILGASALFPADSVIPRYIAYGLGTLAFSSLLIGAADKKLDEAAPTAAASEAITEVDKPNDQGRRSRSTEVDVRLDLALCEVREYGKTFATGKPVRFKYLRGTEKAPNFGPRFGQDIEPTGKYLLHNPQGESWVEGNPRRWEAGEVAFENPLVLRLSTDGDTYGPNGWKARLCQAFKAKRKALACKLRRAGYDGIVTCDDGGTREIVDLRVVSCKH